MYQILRSFLFLFDPEKVHYFSMNALKALCSLGFVKNIITRIFSAKGQNLATKQFGLTFKNPVGLAAGFDKNARYLRELEALGFGAVEIGTVTPLPQAGNDKPRLFRLPKDKALINRMGFNNDGLEVVVERLKAWRLINNGYSSLVNEQIKHGQVNPDCQLPTANCQLIIGGNIGKNKITPNEDAWMDYEKCFNGLFNYVDYFVVNVSSPNTPGLRELQEKESLRKILGHLQMLNKQQPAPKPILLKIAPDLTIEQIDDVIDLALEIQLDGLVACNTTISRENLQTPAAEITAIGMGGVSGKPVTARATEVVRYICSKTKGQVPVIASGGIFTAADAKEKLEAGAILVQVWTGFIYEGPRITRNICKSLPKPSKGGA
jgi:dihydroorotate dehydrogenase